MHITGTVMASGKDFTSDLKKKKLQEYELCACQCDMKMMCLSFHDKTSVTMLSTLFGHQTQLITVYIKKQPVHFGKPMVILEYTTCIEEWTDLISTVDVMDIQGGPTNGEKKILLLAVGSCEQQHPFLQAKSHHSACRQCEEQKFKKEREAHHHLTLRKG
jgi:hypothetical protein